MQTQRIAFFGATGDSAGHCLAFTLMAGFRCVALARTPEKLTQSLSEKGLSGEVLDENLTIVKGDVKDITAVKDALQIDGQVVDTIVSGIGGTPQLQASISTPLVLPDPQLVQDAGRMFLEALGELKSATYKPLFINISTTGIAPEGKPRDVPLAFQPLYHYLLKSPHEDKRELEKVLTEHAQLPEHQRVLRAYVNVRPSLLMDGDGQGMSNIRQGVDEDPAVGYTIHRKDVGAWICENLIKQEPKTEWLNNGVTITT